MLKTKYNGSDLEIVVQEFGIDTTRILSVSEAAPTSPRNWPPNNLTGFLNWQFKSWTLMRSFVDAKHFGDILFVDDEDFASEAKIFEGIPTKYLKESIEFERAFGVFIITMYPILPAFSAQLWQSFRAVATLTDIDNEFNLEEEVWEQSWPEVYQHYELDLKCMVNGEEFVVKIERQYLDGLDESTAVEYAFEDEKIVNACTRETTQIKSYSVEFGATLVFFDPSRPLFFKMQKDKKKEKTQNQ